MIGGYDVRKDANIFAPVNSEESNADVDFSDQAQLESYQSQTIGLSPTEGEGQLGERIWETGSKRSQ